MKSNNKVLIADGVHPLLIEGLEALQLECDYQLDISLKTTTNIIHNYMGIVVNTRTVMDVKMLDLAKNLKFIARLGSGLDMINLEYAKEKRITVIRSPEGNRNAVAEHALGMLLALTNNLIIADKEVKSKQWNREKTRGREIKDLTIGLVGFGHTGQRFAKVLGGLGMNRIYFDPYRQKLETDDPKIIQVNLQTLQEESDIISFHVPLTKETFHMCDTVFLNKCKEGLIIINTSRGKAIKTKDLVEGLLNGYIGGACLDVLENENLDSFNKEEARIFDLLCEMDNVLLSPHIAGWTHESKLKIARVLLEKISATMK